MVTGVTTPVSAPEGRAAASLKATRAVRTEMSCMVNGEGSSVWRWMNVKKSLKGCSGWTVSRSGGLSNEERQV